MTDSPPALPSARAAPGRDTLSEAEDRRDGPPAANRSATNSAKMTEDPNAETMPTRTIEEPILESAPLARRKAAELCRSGHSDGLNCDWYHGLWQYLRIFGVAAAPARNGDFFFDVFEALARDGGSPRVLISGTADYSMLAILLQAYRNCNATPRTTVVDRCETPLFLCRWYAERYDQIIDTCRSDIMDFSAPQPFDVVCCHSFLSRLPPPQRTDLVAVWHRVLRPGGRVVTNTRLNPSWTEDDAGFSADQVTAFRDRVYNEATRLSETLGIDADEIAEDARQYAEKSRTYSIRTQQEIVALFEGGGFDFERLDLIETGGKFGAARSGPGTAQKATYAQIVAVRR